MPESATVTNLSKAEKKVELSDTTISRLWIAAKVSMSTEQAKEVLKDVKDRSIESDQHNYSHMLERMELDSDMDVSWWELDDQHYKYKFRQFYTGHYGKHTIKTQVRYIAFTDDFDGVTYMYFVGIVD